MEEKVKDPEKKKKQRAVLILDKSSVHGAAFKSGEEVYDREGEPTGIYVFVSEAHLTSKAQPCDVYDVYAAARTTLIK